MYYVYHIFDGKVGLTKNPEQRVEKEQGCRKDEYEIVEVVDKLRDALKAEQAWNESLGYKKTPEWHPDIKKMKDTYSYNSGVSITLDHDYIDQETITFIDKDGSKYFFDDVSKIPTQLGRYPEGNPKPFAYWKAIRNEYEAIIEADRAKEELVITKASGDVTITSRQFNKCSTLEIEDTGATLDDVFDLQLSLQQKFPETREIGNQSIADTAIAAQRNWHAFTDEMMEFMDALGGVKDGFGNGAWKYWKKDYQKAKEMKISDLSDEDLLELKFEFVDMLHFFVNFGLMIGMTGQETIDMYVAKNKENFDRQKRGY